MRVEVLGCGEAFDEELTNTSLLLRSDKILLFDCGYSAPGPLWRAVPDHNSVDLIYISHAHADHYFGLPAVLVRMWEEKRTKPLVLLSQPQVLEQVRQLLELGYAGIAKRFAYEIEYLPAKPAETVQWHEFLFRFAPSIHSASNLAVRVEHAGRTFCYTGDGMFTPESSALFANANLVVHEAYSMDPMPMHADIPGLVQMAEQQGVQHLALVHVGRVLRRSLGLIWDNLSRTSRVKLLLPSPGDSLDV